MPRAAGDRRKPTRLSKKTAACGAYYDGMILAGDIGGTKTNIAVFSLENGRVVEQAKKSYPSQNYRSLESVLEDFVAANPASLTAACFGVAGPVVEHTVKTPNLPWFVDGRALARGLGLKSVTLLNDL